MENIKTKTLSIMTYNAWGLKVGPISIAKDYKKRIYALPSEIYRLNPDIILLQEVWKKKDRNFLISELGKRGWKYSFYQNDKHPIVKNWNRHLQFLDMFMLGNGLLTLSKHKINTDASKVQSFNIHTASEEFFTRKGALFCPIHIEKVGHIDCINTHLGSVDFSQNKQTFSEYQKRRHTSQLKELAHFIKENRSRRPLFIGADLNIDDRRNKMNWFPQTKNEFTQTLEKLQLIDSFRYINPDDHGITYSVKNKYNALNPSSGQRLDYLFHSSNNDKIKPILSEIILNKPIFKNNEKYYLSDHFGIMTKYKINY